MTLGEKEGEGGRRSRAAGQERDHHADKARPALFPPRPHGKPESRGPGERRVKCHLPQESPQRPRTGQDRGDVGSSLEQGLSKGGGVPAAVPRVPAGAHSAASAVTRAQGEPSSQRDLSACRRENARMFACRPRRSIPSFTEETLLRQDLPM